MRISDWSSDVCSSDLACLRRRVGPFRSGPVRKLPAPEQYDRGAASPRHPPATARRAVRRAEIGRAHAELQSLMRISYAVFCLKKKKSTSSKRTKSNKQQPNTHKRITTSVIT